MKLRIEGVENIIYSCLVIIGGCVGSVVSAFGVLWIYGMIERLRFGVAGNPGDELVEMIAVVVGTIGGAIAGSFLTSRLIIKLSNRK